MVARLVVLISLLTAVVAIGGVSVTIAEELQSSPSALLETDDLDADEVRIDVALREDGSAEWTLEFWVRLDDEDQTTAFESLERDVEENPDERVGKFADRIDGTVETASDATGREMAAEEFSVGTERQSLAREYGVVRYSFQWNGFADIEGDELHAGDAIEGLYLDDGTRLLVSWPDGYERTSVTPEPDDHRERAVIWSGRETDFVSGEPRIVVSPAGSSRGPGVIAGALGVVAVVTGLAGWWLRRRSTGPGGAIDEADPRPADDATTAAVEQAPDTDESLLSNEERVIRLLEANGGRMKQKRVVEELGWTDAKTSKVVSSLREEGTVESFRIGRENVLRVPDDETEEASHQQ